MGQHAFGRSGSQRRYGSGEAADGSRDSRRPAPVRVVSDWTSRLPSPVPLRLSAVRDDPAAAAAAAEVTRRLMGDEGPGGLPADGSSRLLPLDGAGVIASPATAPDGTRRLVVSGVTPLAAVGDDARAVRAAQTVTRQVNAQVLGYRCSLVGPLLVAANHVVLDAEPAETGYELAARVLRDVFAHVSELRDEHARPRLPAPAPATGFALADEVLRLETAYYGLGYDAFDARTAVDAWRLSLDADVATLVRLSARHDGVRVLLPLPGSSRPAGLDVLTVTLPGARGSGLAFAVDLPSWLPSWLTARLAASLDTDPVQSDTLLLTTPWGVGTWAVRSTEPVGAPLTYRGFVPDTLKPFAELVDVVAGVAVSTWHAWDRLQRLASPPAAPDPRVTTGGAPPR